MNTTIRTVECAKHLCCAVVDSGHGVREDLKESLFKQVLGMTQTGTGIGLYTVRRMAAALGGVVGYTDNRIGEHAVAGSVFWMRIPITYAAIASPAHATMSAPAVVIEAIPKAPRGNTVAVTSSGQAQSEFKGAIMIIDDTPYMLDAICILFEIEG